MQKIKRNTKKIKIADFTMQSWLPSSIMTKNCQKKRITQSQFTQFLAAIAVLYLPSWVSEWVSDSWLINLSDRRGSLHKQVGDYLTKWAHCYVDRSEWTKRWITHSVRLICKYRALRAAKNDFSVNTPDLHQNDQIIGEHIFIKTQAKEIHTLFFEIFSTSALLRPLC